MFILIDSFVVQIDRKDAHYLKEYNWHIAKKENNRFYVVAAVKTVDKWTKIYLHRLILKNILGEDTNKLVDHANNDSLDNRRSNLRYCSKAENNRNRKLNSNNKTGFKGVSKSGNKYQAFIYVQGQPNYLGLFSTPEAGARAYRQAAKELHGVFARLK